MVNTRTKKCSKCGVIRSVFNFAMDNNRKDGFRSWCKECISTDNAKRRGKHADIYNYPKRKD